jgi:signal transduction histidine kinase
MRLKTKLVLAATAVTLLVVLVLSGLFLAELLRQRIEQAVASNDVLANQVRSATREALETGLAARFSADHATSQAADSSPAALIIPVGEVLRHDDALRALMQSIVRYSLTVQDVSVTDARGITLASTDPSAIGQPSAYRIGLKQVGAGSFSYQWQRVFGAPRVFDIAAPLNRNGQPFLVAHVGVRSTFLKASFAPGLRDAFLFSGVAALVLMSAAGLFANVALRPLEAINQRLEQLTAGAEDEAAAPDPQRGRPDTVVQVAKAIGRLERKIRSNEAGYTALQANMEQMLDTLRDGVLLFAAARASGDGDGDLRAVMVSDAAERFLGRAAEAAPGQLSARMIGQRLDEIFAPESAPGAAVLSAFARGGNVASEIVLLEDGRQIQLSIDRITSGALNGQDAGRDIATLVTLRDMESALQLEQELEVSRRLAAIGRITAGVGHEVKNPINAMVLHLELLRGKLASVDGGVSPANGFANIGAQRHVEILVSEMQRLDRVVQTLADFSRPMEMHLKVVDLRDIVASVIELTWEQMQEHNVTVQAEATRQPLLIHVDSDLVRQALLNLVLNGMQAMAEGGTVQILLRREHGGAQTMAVIEVKDHGAGIPSELLPRIFDLYFTTKKGGSGIGLATTYRILQMHGGALDVRSITDAESPDRGSVFTMRLPVASAPGGRGDRTAEAVKVVSLVGPVLSMAEQKAADREGIGREAVDRQVVGQGGRP